MTAILVAALSWLLLGPEDRGPIFEGRHVADWVATALSEESSASEREIVVKIGAPAVPFIAKQGLYDRSHTRLRRADIWLADFCYDHPSIGWLAVNAHLVKLDNCVEAHAQASELLWDMGTNAESAVGDVIDCIEHCPNAHFINVQDLIDTLGKICGTNPVAIAYLTKTARGTNSFSLRAATMVYYATGDTNLMVETCTRIARENPINLFGQELFWFREDHDLNQHVVPILERLYDDPRIDDQGRRIVMSELTSRSNDATAAITRLLAKHPHTPAP